MAVGEYGVNVKRGRVLSVRYGLPSASAALGLAEPSDVRCTLGR